MPLLRPQDTGCLAGRLIPFEVGKGCGRTGCCSTSGRSKQHPYDSSLGEVCRPRPQRAAVRRPCRTEAAAPEGGGQETLSNGGRGHGRRRSGDLAEQTAADQRGFTRILCLFSSSSVCIRGNPSPITCNPQGSGCFDRFSLLRHTQHVQARGRRAATSRRLPSFRVPARTQVSRIPRTGTRSTETAMEPRKAPTRSQA